MNSLIELYYKNNHTSDKWGDGQNIHTYLEVYDKIFKRLKNNPINMLEIGVYRGDSLNLWSEYFHLSSNIYGLDSGLHQVNINLHDNINLIPEDAYNTDTVNLLKNKYPKFDIIIDDGSHLLYQQIFFVENYFDLLNDNGILIVEDAMCWENDKYDSLCKILKAVPDKYKIFTYHNDRRSIKNFDHDFLVIADLSDPN